MKTQAALKSRKNRNSRISPNNLGVFVAYSLVVTIVMGALPAGCAIGSSHYRSSYDVARQFERGEIVPGYRYYEGGPASKPLAIVAIRADYRLQSKHWRGIDLNDASLKALVERIAYVLRSEYKEAQMIPNGARIFGPDGEMVGMWYSVYDYSQITFLDDKIIYLSAPVVRMPPGVRIPRFD